MDNILNIFKENATNLQKHAGKNKIFHHITCDGNAYSYDVAKINALFEEDQNPEYLLQRLVSMMEYLQTGYHTGEFLGPAGKYKYAQE